jgi:hypothetical protein
VPLLSLPLVLGVNDDVFGADVPYLYAPAHPADVAPWLPAPRDGLRRLGLVWAGNPTFPGRATRDLQPSLLASIVALPHVQWIALQQGPAGAVALPGLHHLPALTDWQQTAAVLAQLDGLVTTDTGIAHLAGAMGVRTWVLLSRVPDWRWGLHGDTSPWYPHTTLVRATRSGSWNGIVEQLAAQLTHTTD